MKTRKIPAFTLSELLVVLVISSIVIALTFLVLTMVQRQISNIQLRFKDQQEIHFINRILTYDMNTHQAFYNAKKAQLSFYNSKDTIAYQFKNNYLLRNKDTVALKIISKNFFLDNLHVKEGWVDAIQLQFNQSYTAKKLFVFRVKDAAHYLNH